MHPLDIALIHQADLRAKYPNQGLDIIEMRAVWTVLPEDFENDGDGKKAEWRFNFRQKLEELTTKEEQNRLARNEKRNNAYKDLDGKSFFDPDTPLERAAATKSGAFDATEKPTDIKSSAGSIAALKKKVGGDKEGMDGILCVHSEATGEWKEYFFDVSSTKIKYFDSKEAADQGSDPVHVMVLDDLSKVEEKPTEEAGKGEGSLYVFDVQNSSSRLQLGARTSEEKDRWTNTIREGIRWARMGASGNGSVANPIARIRKQQNEDNSGGRGRGRGNPLGGAGDIPGGLLAAIQGGRGGGGRGGRGRGNPLGGGGRGSSGGPPDLMAELTGKLKKRQGGPADPGGGGGKPDLMAELGAKLKKRQVDPDEGTAGSAASSAEAQGPPPRPQHAFPPRPPGGLPAGPGGGGGMADLLGGLSAAKGKLKKVSRE